MALPAPRPSIDTCNACGKLFPRVAMRLCTQCALITDHRFELVSEYLRDNQGAAVGDIAGETGVSASDVRRFMDSGRLVAVEGVCTCGGIGERCKTCRSSLTNSFREMEQRMQRDQKPAESGPVDQGSERTTYVRRMRRVDDN